MTSMSSVIASTSCTRRAAHGRPLGLKPWPRTANGLSVTTAAGLASMAYLLAKHPRCERLRRLAHEDDQPRGRQERQGQRKEAAVEGAEHGLRVQPVLQDGKRPGRRVEHAALRRLLEGGPPVDDECAVSVHVTREEGEVLLCVPLEG